MSNKQDAVDDTAELCKALSSLMERERERIEARADFLKSSIELISQDPPIIRFEVKLSSSWQGEKDVRARSKKSLPDAVRAAQKQFKKINDRSDIQGSYIAYAVIGKNRTWDGNLYFPIPQKFFSYLL